MAVFAAVSGGRRNYASRNVGMPGCIRPQMVKQRVTVSSYISMRARNEMQKAGTPRINEMVVRSANGECAARNAHQQVECSAPGRLPWQVTTAMEGRTIWTESSHIQSHRSLAEW